MKLSAIIDGIAGQFAGRAKMAKVDVSENLELASEYNIYNIPRVLIFNRSAKPTHQLKGVVPQTELVKLLNEVTGES